MKAGREALFAINAEQVWWHGDLLRARELAATHAQTPGQTVQPQQCLEDGRRQPSLVPDSPATSSPAVTTSRGTPVRRGHGWGIDWRRRHSHSARNSKNPT